MLKNEKTPENVEILTEFKNATKIKVKGRVHKNTSLTRFQIVELINATKDIVKKNPVQIAGYIGLLQQLDKMVVCIEAYKQTQAQ